MSQTCHERTYPRRFRPLISPGRRAAKRAAGTEKLFRGRWHRRGMMVDNEPILAALDVSEAVARRQALGLSVLDIGKCVIAGIYRRTAVHADQLIAEGNLEAGKNLKSRHEIIPQRRPISTYRRRQRPPEHGVVGIERQHLVGIVSAERHRPCGGRRRHVLLRSGRSDGSRRQQDDAQRKSCTLGFQRIWRGAFSLRLDDADGAPRLLLCSTETIAHDSVLAEAVALRILTRPMSAWGQKRS